MYTNWYCDDALRYVGMIFIGIIFVCAIIVPVLIFSTVDYSLVIQSDNIPQAIADIKANDGDSALVWYSHHITLTDNNLLIILRARNDNDIRRFLQENDINNYSIICKGDK